ncbi:MAG: VWA domain-containing protein [Thermoflexales bacterium]
MFVSQPLWLLLLLLVPLSVAIAWPRLRMAEQHQSRRLNRAALLSMALRTLLITCVTLALAGVGVQRPTSRLAVAFVVDASDSIGASGLERAAQFVRESLAFLRITNSDDDDRAAVVLFGAEAQIEQPLLATRELLPFSAQVRTDGTDIEGAIRLAVSLLPRDANRRLVLLSDGMQTRGDAVSLARLLGVPIDVVPIAYPSGPDVLLERLDAPTRVSAGQAIPLMISARALQPMRGELIVQADGRIIERRPVNLVAGPNVFAARATATEPGFSTIRAQIVAEGDVRPQNNTLSAAVIVSGPPRVLLVASDSPAGQSRADEIGALRSALTAAGISWETAPPATMPTDLFALSSYQAIVLANVPARELSTRAMDALQRYVRDVGGGLVVIGGPSSYGVGGYYRTPLEETLPVEAQVKDPRRFPSVSIVLVMDKSGSMNLKEGNVTKMRLAAEAAARVAELANDEDEITVIAFDTEPVDVIGPFLGRDKQRYIGQILRIAPGGGGIYAYESLKEAERIITRSTRQSKFIILLADGDDTEQQEGVPELVRKMREVDEVTLTVVAIGNGADVPFLQRIAALGGGRFHLTNRAASLPTIFTEEAARAQRSYIVEREFLPRRGADSPMLRGIDLIPPLLGHVATTAKPAAQVILWANESDPLLAAWQYGLGRAVAFTSDATARWAKAWLGWEHFPRFWSQVLRWTILERNESALAATMQPRGEFALLTAEVAEAIASNVTLTATLFSQQGESRDVPLVQTAPGRFEAMLTLEPATTWFARIRSSNGDEALIPYTHPYSPEYGPASKLGELGLREIAQVSGGAVLESPAQVFRPAALAVTRLELSPWLLLAAALLLPCDVAARRLAGLLEHWLGGLSRSPTERRTRMPATAPLPTIAATPQVGTASTAPARPGTPSTSTAELLRRRQQRRNAQQGDPS